MKVRYAVRLLKQANTPGAISYHYISDKPWYDAPFSFAPDIRLACKWGELSEIRRWATDPNVVARMAEVGLRRCDCVIQQVSPDDTDLGDLVGSLASLVDLGDGVYPDITAEEVAAMYSQRVEQTRNPFGAGKRPDFSRQMQQAMEGALLKYLSSGEWITKWANSSQLQLPSGMLRQVFDSIDMTRVAAKVAEKLEDRVADAVIAAMATEVGTDVKKIMSNGELREDLRATLRGKIREAKDKLA